MVLLLVVTVIVVWVMVVVVEAVVKYSIFCPVLHWSGVKVTYFLKVTATFLVP
jgi:hypothetical protein